MDKKRLIQIIRILEEIRGELDLNIADQEIFIQACTYERGEIANQNKHSQTFNTSASNGKKESDVITREAEKSIYKPSPKQLKILRSAKIKEEVISTMSKQEVSEVVGTYLKNLERRNI